MQTPEARAAAAAMFAERGYCVVRQLFSADDVARIAAAFDGLLANVDRICAEHGEQITTQLRANWKPNSPGENSLNRGRAGVRVASGSNYALSPRPDLSPQRQREAVEAPTAELMASHLISDCGKEEPVLAELGRDPRLLTLAADVLDRQALAAAGQHSLYRVLPSLSPA